MDTREAETFNAAMRLLKSKLRYRLYSSRPNESHWSKMLSLEQAILEEAKEGWDAVCSKWDLSLVSTHETLKGIIHEAALKAIHLVVDTFDELTGNSALDILAEYVEDTEWCNILPKEVLCKSATS